MPKPSRCIVDGCPNPSHAKGYCRRHYGQIWRRGMIYSESPREQAGENDSHLKRDDQERLRALERELKRAQQMYDVVVGFQGRIKWRRELDGVQSEIRKIMEAQPELNSAEADAQVPASQQAKVAHQA